MTAAVLPLPTTRRTFGSRRPVVRRKDPTGLRGGACGDRALHLIDLENLCGAGSTTAEDAARVLAAYVDAVKIGPMDSIHIGVAHHMATAVMSVLCVFPGRPPRCSPPARGGSRRGAWPEVRPRPGPGRPAWWDGVSHVVTPSAGPATSTSLNLRERLLEVRARGLSDDLAGYPAISRIAAPASGAPADRARTHGRTSRPRFRAPEPPRPAWIPSGRRPSLRPVTAKDRTPSEPDPLNQRLPRLDPPIPRSPQPDPAALPDAVDRMMTAGDDDANAAYYRVEDLIFHNRHSGLDLTQAAEPVAALVLTAIRSGSWTPGGLVHGLDMLVEIVMGEPDATERARGNTRLVERCRAAVRAALPELYALVDRDEERILQGVIDLAAELEPDAEKRRWVYETVRGRIGRRVVLNSLRGLEQTLDPPPRETAADGAAPRTGTPVRSGALGAWPSRRRPADRDSGRPVPPRFRRTGRGPAVITPSPRPRRLRLVAGSYRLGPVEEGTVVAHHHWGYEVRLHETGDIGTVDPIFVHDDPGIGMNPENWPAVGEIVRVRRQTTMPQGELRLTTRAGDLARPWAEPPDNGMNYQIVEWHRTRGHAQDPALIASEMDSGRVTRRIVEIYDDGRADLGDATSEPPVETGDTEVNRNPLPSLIMVNSSPEFTGHEVGRECFEALWRAARRQHPELGPEPPAPDPLREADDALTARIRELLEDLLARGESSAEAIGRIGAALREAAHRWHREDAVSVPTARFLVSVDCWIPQTCEHYSADELEDLRTRLRNELLSALREAPSTLEEACKGIARYDPWDLIRSPLWAPAILLVRHLIDPESAPDPGGLLLTELIVGMVYEHAQRWSLTGTMSPHHLLMLTCVQCALARTDEDGRARRAVRLLLDQFMG